MTSRQDPNVFSHLKRDLDEKSFSEIYRYRFRLPFTEHLNGDMSCHLWTSYNRVNVSGTIFLSMNFICFASKVNQ
jgi:hypothetical protein